MDSLCYYCYDCFVMATDLDVRIIRLYKKGFSVSEIHRSIRKTDITFRTIARTIAQFELTIRFESGEEDGFFIIPSIINYDFRL